MKKILLSAAVVATLSSSVYGFGFGGLPSIGASKDAAASLTAGDVDAVFLAVKNAEYFLGESSKVNPVGGVLQKPKKFSAVIKGGIFSVNSPYPSKPSNNSSADISFNNSWYDFLGINSPSLPH